MIQKNEVSPLSTKALGLHTRLAMAGAAVFLKAEILALCPEKRAAVETMMSELMKHDILKPLPEAPGRKSAYLFTKKCVENQVSSTTTTTDHNKQQINKESAADFQHMPKISADYQQICADYQLPFAFLAEQIAIREKTISPVTPDFVRGLLDYAKTYSNKNYSGFVRTLFRSPTFFLPQFATPTQPVTVCNRLPVAQDSGYAPRTPSQDAPERQAAPTVAPPVSTPPNATQTARTAKVDGWKDYMQKRLTDPSSYKTWIAPCSATRDAAGQVTIIVPMDEHAFWLNEYYVQALTDAFQHAGTPAKSLQFVVQSPGVNG